MRIRPQWFLIAALLAASCGSGGVGAVSCSMPGPAPAAAPAVAEAIAQ